MWSMVVLLLVNSGSLCRGGVEPDDLRVGKRFHDDILLITSGRAIMLLDALTVYFDNSRGGNEIALATRNHAQRAGSPVFEVEPKTRVLARTGNASSCLLKPEATGTKGPSRDLGKGPCTSGRVQFGGSWKNQYLKVSGLVLLQIVFGLGIPLPADIICTSPASMRPRLPRLSSRVMAPFRR
jgi:hypothetical protein